VNHTYRRQLLTTAAVALTTGCLSRSSGDPTTTRQTSSGEPTTTATKPPSESETQTVSPTAPPSESATETVPQTESDEATTQSTVECDGRVQVSVSVTPTTSETFELSTTTETVPYGGQLAVTLENTSEKRQTSGVRSKIDIQRRDGDSWESILYRDERVVWYDLAVRHAPGEGFEWNVEIGPGVDFAESTNPSFQACEGADLGMYRFVYWGIGGRSDGGRRALSTQFRLESNP